eukprot:366341-Chlamydomonas_euryale.AAC.15
MGNGRLVALARTLFCRKHPAPRAICRSRADDFVPPCLAWLIAGRAQPLFEAPDNDRGGRPKRRAGCPQHAAAPPHTRRSSLMACSAAWSVSGDRMCGTVWGR